MPGQRSQVVVFLIISLNVTFVSYFENFTLARPSFFQTLYLPLFVIALCVSTVSTSYNCILRDYL